MTDSPEGQTQSCSQEEEMRSAYLNWNITYKGAWDEKSWEAWQAALASQAEQVRKLEERELSLLAVIEQMKEEIEKLR